MTEEEIALQITQQLIEKGALNSDFQRSMGSKDGTILLAEAAATLYNNVLTNLKAAD
ncbi:hypothetical protein NZD89_05050 [Alicyclobacillus fastidiosus]|uniref:Uncharacterized protein n=1 Tax=Alicyclobacillus fastidiosus TaxID=392011 RepID=A0ABY6ZLJ3_9BACL|nr:hypothetical protein [Alicyclobacillus fastidiosus]WAH42800.1 hypothetical protein NZD89_05050 [Alicyclobacillus fastidiosus]GMA64721.1 hypothetical protein GCM10025859_51610 [Alicyclobacillus fastidiosus]